LSRWRYAVLATLVAILFFEFIFWMFNMPVLTIILTSGNLSIIDKLNVLASPIKSINSISGTFVVVMMLILAVVQGISIAELTYTIRHQKKIDSKLIGGSSLVGLLAIIGLGCPACGTSLLTPIVALFVSSSAVAVSEKITAIALPLAIIIGIYGLYVIGLKAASARAHHMQNNNQIIT
jgi:hypothetical protein